MLPKPLMFHWLKGRLSQPNDIGSIALRDTQQCNLVDESTHRFRYWIVTVIRKYR